MAKLRSIENEIKASVWMRYVHHYDGAALACFACKTIWKECPTFEMEDYIQTFDFNRRCRCGAYNWTILEGDYY